jgi:N-acetylglucosaminyldiphosphoundecaprenol N-acetyl-beta-D-mannosaminyltransferase
VGAAGAPGTVAAPVHRPPRFDVLGVQVSAVTMNRAVATLDGWIRGAVRTYVCVTGVHGVMECQRDEELSAIHNAAGMVTPDGRPLVWIGRARATEPVDQVCGPDLLPTMCQHSLLHGYRHYFYGAADGVALRLADRLRRRFPGLQVVGAFAPPFRPVSAEEDRRITEEINAARPDLVWVGLSTPKQERWMHAHRARLTAPVLIGVGAAFDLHAGLRRRAPRWMQVAGLEWLFRLGQEPRRLSRRYLVNNPRFVAALLKRTLTRPDRERRS